MRNKYYNADADVVTLEINIPEMIEAVTVAVNDKLGQAIADAITLHIDTLIEEQGGKPPEPDKKEGTGEGTGEGTQARNYNNRTSLADYVEQVFNKRYS